MRRDRIFRPAMAWAIAGILAGALPGAGLLRAQSAAGLAAAADDAAARPVTRADAEEIFARLKALAGDWEGRSTKGWESRVTYRVIARGATLLSTSQFRGQGGPQDGMATAYHMDSDRLLLTHYCEAGNQPRLAASMVSGDGRTVTFTFLDGTNLPSRDRGHMDKVIVRFLDDNSFTSRWTWYQDGQERWFEEIRYSRVREHHD